VRRELEAYPDEELFSNNVLFVLQRKDACETNRISPYEADAA
jgi:hypothetical protein